MLENANGGAAEQQCLPLSPYKKEKRNY